MTKSQFTMLNKLLEDKDVKGKSYIEKFIWLNTVKPKYNVGDCYEVTDHGHYIFGVPVRNFKAKIVGIRFWPSDKLVNYEMIAKVKCGDKETDLLIIMPERAMGNKKVKDNYNVIEGKTTEPNESLDI